MCVERGEGVRVESMVKDEKDEMLVVRDGRENSMEGVLRSRCGCREGRG